MEATFWEPRQLDHFWRSSERHSLTISLLRERILPWTIQFSGKVHVASEEWDYEAPSFLIHGHVYARTWKRVRNMPSVAVTSFNTGSFTELVTNEVERSEFIAEAKRWLVPVDLCTILWPYDARVSQADLERVCPQLGLEIPVQSADDCSDPSSQSAQPRPRKKPVSSIEPRQIRLRDAPRYLGMDRHRFNADVRPQVTEIRVGKQGIAFDRKELDDWVEYNKRACGRPPEKEETWRESQRPDSAFAAASGIFRNK